VERPEAWSEQFGAARRGQFFKFFMSHSVMFFVWEVVPSNGSVWRVGSSGLVLIILSRLRSVPCSVSY
jgi:hypothetical protein